MSMEDRPAKKRKLCFSPDMNSPAIPTPCSSSESTHSSDLTKEITRIADPEDENSTCGTDCRDINRSSRGEKTVESGEMEQEREREKKSAREEKMPSEAELEEFFSAAEKQIREKFAEKYNFDIAKEQPLEGRYEWVKINP